MCYGKKPNKIFVASSLLILTIALLFISLWSISCNLENIKSDLYILFIKNHTQEVLTIHIQAGNYTTGDWRVFEMDPGNDGQITIYGPGSWHITAKNANGETVFSQNITKEQIVNSGIVVDNHYTYTVIISSINKGVRTNNGTTP